jgi:hypothetical protein
VEAPKDGRQLTQVQINYIEDRFMSYWRDWQINRQDNMGSKNHVVRMYYQAVLDCLLDEGFVKAGNKNHKS